ncbi:MAG: tetratricopeptide repeat protein [Magnetovibrionaceae bacterium]
MTAAAAFFAKAQMLHQAGEWDSAEMFYRQVLEELPENSDALHMLGVLHLQRGDPAGAIELIEKAIAAGPVAASFYTNLANAQKAAGLPEAALESYRTLLAQEPDHLKARLAEALTLVEVGRAGEAVPLLEALCEERAEDAALRDRLGNILVDIGRPAAAERRYREALDLEPDAISPLYNLGLCLAGRGAFAEAQETFEEVLERDPDHAGARNNLAAVLIELGDLAAASETYEQLLASAPDNPSYRYNAALVATETGDLDRALALFEELGPLDPGMTAEWESAARKALDFDLVSRLGPLVDGATAKAIATGERPAETPMAALQRHDDPARSLAIAKAWSAAMARQAEAMAAAFALSGAGQETSDGRLTLGFISGNFRDHPTARNTVRILELLDRKRFRVLLFSHGREDDSAIAKRLARAADATLNLQGWSAEAMAQAVRESGVNILIHLQGHTGGSRMEVAALRPAPLNVAWLTFAGTTGADFMDYLIADGQVAPEGADPHYSEALIRLPDTYWPTDDRFFVTPPKGTRADYGLNPEAFVIAAFHQTRKIEADILDQWFEILRQVGGSQLWLLEPPERAKRNLLGRAEAFGLKGDRFVFGPLERPEAHVQRLHLADVAIDTGTYTGHTTTVDCLRAGVPVVTWEGRQFAARVSASLLRAAGLGSLIAPSRREMASKVIELARDLPGLTALRKQVMVARAESALFDSRRFTRHLEAGLLEAWEGLQRGEDPKAIWLSDKTG